MRHAEGCPRPRTQAAAGAIFRASGSPRARQAHHWRAFRVPSAARCPRRALMLGGDHLEDSVQSAFITVCLIFTQANPREASLQGGSPLFKVPPQFTAAQWREKKKWAPRNKGKVLMMLFEFGLIFSFPLTHNNSVCCAIQDSGAEGGEKLPAITNSRAEARRVRGPRSVNFSCQSRRANGSPKELQI